MVTPLRPTVTSLASVVGRSPSTGTVTLSGPAPTGGVVVTLTSSNTTLVTVPLSVTVAPGGKRSSFPAGSKVVNKKTWGIGASPQNGQEDHGINESQEPGGRADIPGLTFGA